MTETHETIWVDETDIASQTPADGSVKYRRADLPPKVNALVWIVNFAYMAGMTFKIDRVGQDFILERHHTATIIKSCHPDEESAKDFAQEKANKFVLRCLEGES